MITNNTNFNIQSGWSALNPFNYVKKEWHPAIAKIVLVAGALFLLHKAVRYASSSSKPPTNPGDPTSGRSLQRDPLLGETARLDTNVSNVPTSRIRSQRDSADETSSQPLRVISPLNDKDLSSKITQLQQDLAKVIEVEKQETFACLTDDFLRSPISTILTWMIDKFQASPNKVNHDKNEHWTMIASFIPDLQKTLTLDYLEEYHARRYEPVPGAVPFKDSSKLDLHRAYEAFKKNKTADSGCYLYGIIYHTKYKRITKKTVVIENPNAEAPIIKDSMTKRINEVYERRLGEWQNYFRDSNFNNNPLLFIMNLHLNPLGRMGSSDSETQFKQDSIIKTMLERTFALFSIHITKEFLRNRFIRPMPNPKDYQNQVSMKPFNNHTNYAIGTNAAIEQLLNENASLITDFQKGEKFSEFLELIKQLSSL